MKKRAIILCLILSSFIGLKAQSQTGYGTSFVNPQITSFDFSVITNSKSQGFNVGFNIGGGHYLSDNVAVIGTLGINSKRFETQKESSMLFAGGIRVVPFGNMFIGAQIGYNRKTQTLVTERVAESIPLILDASYGIFVGRNFAIEPGFYWQYGFLEKRQQFGVKVGFGIYF